MKGINIYFLYRKGFSNNSVARVSITEDTIKGNVHHGNINIRLLHLLSINTSDSRYLGVVRDRNVEDAGF